MTQIPTVLAEATTEAPAAETGHTTEGTEAHGGGAFPPLDTSTFPSQLFWLVVFFGLLYLLMSKVALPRLASSSGSTSPATRFPCGQARTT